jgi:hypothetical protein
VLHLRVIEEGEIYGGGEQRNYQNDRDDNRIHSVVVTVHRPVGGRLGGVAPTREGWICTIRRWRIFGAWESTT